MLCSIQELVDLKNTAPNRILHFGGDVVRAADITPEIAERFLDHHHNIALQRRQLNKHNRPWEIVDVTGKLDTDQPWLGFEYETGLNSQKDYEALINYVWFNTMHVAFDMEGYGPWSPEITYPPQNLAEYVNGTSYLQKTIKWMNESGVKMASFGDARVGTHLNLSTPSFRKLSDVKQDLLTHILSRSLVMMSEEEMRPLFGRRLYGLATRMAGWVEFKMFRSTDDLVVFNGYIKVATRMAEVMEYLARSNAVGSGAYINNLPDVLHGKTEVAGMDLRELNAGMRNSMNIVGWRHYCNTYETYRNTGKEVAHVRSAA